MSANSDTELWQKVLQDFREICILRREGCIDQANQLLQTQLPQSILSWQRATSLDANAQRNCLEEMFQQEMRRFDDVWDIYRFLAQRLENELSRTLHDRMQEEIKKQVIHQLHPTLPIQVQNLAGSGRLLRHPHPPYRRVSPQGTGLDTIASLTSRKADLMKRPPASDVKGIIDLVIDEQNQMADMAKAQKPPVKPPESLPS